MTDQKKPRVMIADDESHCRLVMKAILTSMKCDVVAEASNGDETVQLFKEHKPHLLLLDINMPLKNGDEVLQEIFKDFPNAFVVMLTSVTDMDTVERCLELGAANYIRKDTPLEEIKTIIKETWQVFARSKGKARPSAG